MYTISRGFFNVKKLEKVEVEEVARSIQTELSVSEKQQMYLPSNIIGFLRLIDRFFPILPSIRDCWPISGFPKTLEYFPISSQIFNWLLNIFAGVISFSFDKILFSLFLSLFFENNLYFIFLVGSYFDLFFYILIDFNINLNKKYRRWNRSILF